MINKVSYVQHVPGHHNSKNELAEWVVKSHKTGKILSSHKSKSEAEAHLGQMEMHKYMKAALTKVAHCGPCGTGFTKIHTTVGVRNLKEIKIGDEVYSFNLAEHKIVANKVINVFSRWVDPSEVFALSHIGHYNLAFTGNHPFLTAKQGFKRLDEILPEEELWHLSIHELDKARFKLDPLAAEKLAKMRKLNDAEAHKRQVKTKHQNWLDGKFKYVCSDETKNQLSQVMKDYYQNTPEEVVRKRFSNWGKSMRDRPSYIEKEVIKVASQQGLPLVYCGDGDVWFTGKTKKRLNPDFKVEGQDKVVEVYNPLYVYPDTNQIRGQVWVAARTKMYEDIGIKCLCLALTGDTPKEEIASKLSQFVHNGVSIKKKVFSNINAKATWKNLIPEEDYREGKIKVYDIECTPDHNYVTKYGFVVHNCSPDKFWAIQQLSDTYFKDKEAVDNNLVGELAELAGETADLEPFINKLNQAIQQLATRKDDKGESKYKDLEHKLQQISTTLEDIQNKIQDGEFEVVDKEDLTSKKEAAKMEPTDFSSVLEDVVQKIQSNQPSLEVARQWVTDKVQASGIKDIDKQTIIKTINDPRINHVMPTGMKDQSSLVVYLFNSILKYKGLGVIKKQENTIPNNSNRPTDIHPDPEEHQDEGYGGDRLGGPYSPKGISEAALKQNLGTLKRGEVIVVTASKADKSFFFVKNDPSLVGIVASNLIEPYNVFLRKQVAEGFLKVHKVLAKSHQFVTKLAADFSGLVDKSVIDQLQEIRTEVSTNKDRVTNQLSVSPVINASVRLADAAQYFALRGSIPTEQDTIKYIRSTMAAHTGLPEQTWSDDLIKIAIKNRKVTATNLDWSDKMLLMQQWHKSGKISQSVWQSLMQLLDSEDLNEIRVGVEKLFDKASETVGKPPTQKQADAIPPAPTTPAPTGKKYMWDAPSSQYILVDASLRTKAEDVCINRCDQYPPEDWCPKCLLKKKELDLPLVDGMELPEEPEGKWPGQELASPVGFPHFGFNADNADKKAFFTPTFDGGFMDSPGKGLGQADTADAIFPSNTWLPKGQTDKSVNEDKELGYKDADEEPPRDKKRNK